MENPNDLKSIKEVLTEAELKEMRMEFMLSASYALPIQMVFSDEAIKLFEQWRKNKEQK